MTTATTMATEAMAVAVAEALVAAMAAVARWDVDAVVAEQTVAPQEREVASIPTTDDCVFCCRSASRLLCSVGDNFLYKTFSSPTPACAWKIVVHV